MNRENILRRVRSLLRLADAARNSNPGERANAKRAASKLIRQHGITNSEIAGDGPDAERLAAVDPNRPRAYCGRCSTMRYFRGVYCVVCARVIWELVAKIDLPAVRTTSADYGRLNRYCEPISRRKRLSHL